MRPIPAELKAQIKPVPRDFAPPFEDHGNYIRWSAHVPIEGQAPVHLELGFSKVTGKIRNAELQEDLRESVWQVMELARLGRTDLIAFASADRHSGRIPVPPEVKLNKTPPDPS